jgi:putative copper export protein
VNVLHTAHVVLAGIWLGSLTFTTLVVSPALKAIDWQASERVLVRSRIGRRFSRVAMPNLLLLLGCLLADGVLKGLPGSDRAALLWSELALVAAVIGLSSSHGFSFGQQLKQLAERERDAAPSVAEALARRRERLQLVSFGANLANLAMSLAVAVLAINL